MTVVQIRPSTVVVAVTSMSLSDGFIESVTYEITALFAAINSDAIWVHAIFKILETKTLVTRIRTDE